MQWPKRNGDVLACCCLLLVVGEIKIRKCLENGPFWDQKWVKNGSKSRFSKGDPGPSMMLKQVFLAHFEPVETRFGPWKIPKCLVNGPFWDQKWVKNGSKTRFSRSDPDQLASSNKCFYPILSPFLPSLAPSTTCMHHFVPFTCTLEPYGGAT